MNLGELLRRLDVLQRSRGFKIAATVLVALIGLGAGITYAAAVTGPAADRLAERFGTAAPLPAEESDAASDDPQAVLEREARTAFQETEQAVRSLLSAQADPTFIVVSVVAGIGLTVTVIWLGLGLTYAGVLLLVGGAVGLVTLAGAPVATGVLVGGVAVLAMAFTTLLQLLRIGFSGSHPVTAVARNVLAEAVRMKVSLVFIVLLIFMLAALPGLMDEDEELRYRVQSFLQYGTGGAYLVVAVLTVFFSVSTVATEQRDKTIWQTVTKPVSAWQFVLGKWLGVVGLNAVLLTVCATGVFLFTEYLRSTPAAGEQSAYVVPGDGTGISRDRLILESQILTARESVGPLPSIEPDDPEFLEFADQQIGTLRKSDPDFAATPRTLIRAVEEIYTRTQSAYRSIEPGGQQVYRFEGLAEAKASGRPLTVRYKIQSGGNRPDEFYRISFLVIRSQPLVRDTSLDITQTVTLSPSAVADDGSLELLIVNGDLETNRANPRTFTIPPDGLTISYSAGTFAGNFFRVAIVLWIKLAFVAMVGVFAATFLSFPVAALISVGTLIIAEGAAYVGQALEYYGTTNFERETVWYKVAVQSIAGPVVQLFGFYSELQPTTRLVRGELLSWGAVTAGIALLGAFTAVLFFASIVSLRRRELAIYSGN
ncbi:MAG: ABC transporter permease subunit [Planctomycetota bacterium]